jgi:hypothetical protein
MQGKLSFSIALFAILLIALTGNSAWAAPPNIRWSTARQIPGYPSKTDPPYLVADRNRTVHALHAQPVNDQPAIVYSTWTMERGWTMPVDVLLAPRSANTMSLGGVFLDAKGTVHVIWLAGDATSGGDVYYSRAATVEAGRSAAWSAPRLVGENARLLATMVALAGDDEGNLYIFYSGSKGGNGLYEVSSRDGGDTWSDSLPVFLTNDSVTYPGEIALLIGQKELHIAWTVWIPPYGGEQLYYARLDTERNKMTSPVLLSRPSTGAVYLPGAPSMMIYNDALFLIYHEITASAGGSMVKLIRQSTDHGRSWTTPVWAFPPLVGGNGAATMLIDSNNGLHAVLANRSGDCCHGMWYSIREKGRWSELQAIITPGPKTPMFDPQIPQAVISQGNVILATWVNEERYNGVWYSYAKLDAPELPVVPFSTPVHDPTPGANTSPITAVPTAPPSTRLPVANIATDVPVAPESSPSFSVLVGVLPVLVLIALIGLWRTRH